MRIGASVLTFPVAVMALAAPSRGRAMDLELESAF